MSDLQPTLKNVGINWELKVLDFVRGGRIVSTNPPEEIFAVIVTSCKGLNVTLVVTGHKLPPYKSINGTDLMGGGGQTANRTALPWIQQPHIFI